jgi:hypothetical protein
MYLIQNQFYTHESIKTPGFELHTVTGISSAALRVIEAALILCDHNVVNYTMASSII